ncbi:MAG: putative lipid II flippase FtsW [Spirochaetia bacterium]|nr:putative lipid II flippase FtsW [Spirochaetia bacterium]
MTTKTFDRADYLLFLNCLVMTLFGFLMIYSASSVLAYDEHGDGAFYFKRQVVWAMLGTAAGWALYKLDSGAMKKWVLPALVISIVLMYAVHIPGLGHRVNGATRWLRLGSLSFQPAEMTKLFYVIYVAKVFADDGLPWTKKMIRTGSITAIVWAGLIFQKDLGGAVIVALIYMGLLIIAGLPLWIPAMLFVAGIAGVAFLIKFESYRMRRLLAFLNPWADPQGAGWQIIQSLTAVGSGGLFGLGYTNSRQKFLYLPEPHTDYIFSIIAEEWGMLGALFVIAMVAVILWRGMFIAINSRDNFNKLMASGLTLMLVIQAFINIGVSLGVLPSKGTTLPFISAGGSSLLVSCCALGLLLASSRLAYGGRR